MFALIVALFVAAICLLLAEVFIPGWVLGTLGMLTIALALILTFIQYGLAIGSIVTVVVTASGTVGFFVWMRVFPDTIVGRKLINRSIAGEAPHKKDSSLSPGMEGVALTDLRPAGTARFANHRVDVVSESVFIAKDSAICITLIEGARVVVRPLTNFEP
ncbi:MAG TPA: NfeD family protein [Chthoniobacterales bacterium]